MGTVFTVVVVTVFGLFLYQRNVAQSERTQTEAALTQAEMAERASRQLAVTAARAESENALLAPALPAHTASAPVGNVRVKFYRSGRDAADAVIVRRLSDALPAQGFERSPNAELTGEQVCGNVRYFHADDREVAGIALELMNAALENQRDIRRLQLEDRSQTRSASAANAGLIEIWLPPFSDAPPGRANDRAGEFRFVAAGCAVVGSDREWARCAAQGPQCTGGRVLFQRTANTPCMDRCVLHRQK